MKRLFHKLFRRHNFEPFELVEDNVPVTTGDGERAISTDPNGLKVWYVGYRCSCGEPGFMVGPIGV